MSRPDAHARFEELAVGHALDALEPEDDLAFRAHLAGCGRCQQDVADHVETLAQLAQLSEPVEPPPELLDGIRAGIGAPEHGAGSSPARAGQQPDGGAAGSGAAATAGTGGGAGAGSAAAPVYLEAARRDRDAARRHRATLWTGVAAAFALVASLVGWNVSLVRERDAAQAWAAQLATTVQALADGSTTTVQLADDDGEVRAVAVLQPDRLRLVAAGLEPNDAERTSYVLWGLSRSGDVRAVGAFDVTSRDLDVLGDLPLPDGSADVAALLVTHEPTREVPAVTSQPVLVSGEV
jgi:hypothetical protein